MVSGHLADLFEAIVFDGPYRPDGPRPAYDGDAGVSGRLEETFRWTFPQLAAVTFEHRWGGPIAITARFIPASGWLAAERLAYGFGYNGHGLAASHLNGQVLRDLLLERRTALAELALVRKRPIPFPPRFIADPLARMSARALQRCDDESRPAREPLILRALNRWFG